MSLIINPGSGPVEGATEEDARRNLSAFCADLAPRTAVVDEGIPLHANGDGRWAARIVVDGAPVEVDMPGLPLDRVRFLDEAGQNIWDFPRLYINGSSWVWMFALGVCGEEE